jgi:hypothetical protein
MIEYLVVCDNCKGIIDGSEVSAAYTRKRAIKEGSLKRYKKKDLCAECEIIVREKEHNP